MIDLETRAFIVTEIYSAVLAHRPSMTPAQASEWAFSAVSAVAISESISGAGDQRTKPGGKVIPIRSGQGDEPDGAA